jgi:hypothetical protein
MGGGGAVGRGRRPSPRYGGRLLLLPKPALQGAFAGQRGRVGGGGQADADVASAPGRVLLPQRQGGGVEGVAVGGSSRAGSVGGLQALRRVAEALEQLADGAGAEVQGVGDSGGGLSALGAALDEAAQG